MGLIAIVGPTGVGKTAVAVAMARRLGTAELINADSRQVVRGLAVGTCAPTPFELGRVRCHLLSMREPGEPFTVADWLAAARDTVDDLERRHLTGLVVGGTGLYIDALLDGFQVAGGPVDPGIRNRRHADAAGAGGLARLVEELAARDPGAIGDLDLNNPRRVIRALEILDAGHGSLRNSRRRTGGRPARVIGIDASNPTHDALIRARSEVMVRGGGLVAEVRSALDRGVSRAALAGSGIGYSEALALLDGDLTPEAAVEAIRARTRRYAKAQRTWFRRRAGVVWLERTGSGGDVEELAGRIVEAQIAGAGT